MSGLSNLELFCTRCLFLGDRLMQIDTEINLQKCAAHEGMQRNMFDTHSLPNHNRDYIRRFYPRISFNRRREKKKLVASHGLGTRQVMV